MSLVTSAATYMNTFLEVPGQSAPQPVVGHSLQSGVADAHGEIHSDFQAEIVRPGEGELRPQIHRRDAGVIRRGSLKLIASFRLARHNGLQGESIFVA